MSNVTFKLNRSGLIKLLKSTEMQKLLQEEASAIKSRCGDGYEQDIYVGVNRANAMVWAETPKAKSESYKNNTILKAVRG